MNKQHENVKNSPPNILHQNDLNEPLTGGFSGCLLDTSAQRLVQTIWSSAEDFGLHEDII